MTTPGPQHYCLRWNNYQSNITATFEQLLQNEILVDVTLAVSGRSLKAHKIILSACSPYFRSILGENPCNHPIIILQDVSYADLHAVIQFMYKGEIQVTEQQLPSLLKVAETLKVRGLADIPESSLVRRDTPDGAAYETTLSPRAEGSPEMLETSVEIPGATSPPSGGHVIHTSTGLRAPGTLHHTGRTMSQSEQHEAAAEIRPGIAELIKDEERAKLLETATSWNSPSPETTFQHQLQQAWQKSWNQKQSLLQNLRFRERGSIKSWRPETMAEAIMSVLREGHTLSQAARKYDIPYPTFVLYANRVHNLLGPSIEGPGCSPNEMRPKGRGRPQRILLGSWPDDTVKNVIRAVVFRDTSALKQQMEEQASAATRSENGIPPALKLAQCQPPNGRLPYPIQAPPISHMNGIGDASSGHRPQYPIAKPAVHSQQTMGTPGRSQMPNLLGFPDMHMMMRMFPPGTMNPSGAVPTINLPAVGDTKPVSVPRQPYSRPVPPLSSITTPTTSPSLGLERPTDTDQTPPDHVSLAESRDLTNARSQHEVTGDDVMGQSRIEPIILPRRPTGEAEGEPIVTADGAMDARTEPVKKSRSEERQKSRSEERDDLRMDTAALPADDRSGQIAVPQRRSPTVADLPDMPRLVSAAPVQVTAQGHSPPLRSAAQPMLPPWHKPQGSSAAPTQALQATP